MRAAFLSLLLAVLACPLFGQDESLAPDGTNSSDSGTSCDASVHATLDDDPDAPGGDWCTADNNNTSWTFQVTMPTPTSALDTSADAQTLKYYVRSFDEGQSADPTIQAHIYDQTTTPCDTLHQSLTLTTITDAGYPATITDTWTAAGLSAAADVCIQIDCTKTGGALGARNSCDIDAIEWDVTWAAAGGRRRLISR